MFPGDLLEPTYTPENSNDLIARSEVERRGQYIEQLTKLLPNGANHPIPLLIGQCLRNNPSQRPTIEEVLRAIEEMKDNVEGRYGDIARADAVREVTMIRALKKREEEVQEKIEESAEKDDEIQHLQQELEVEQV